MDVRWVTIHCLQQSLALPIRKQALQGHPVQLAALLSEQELGQGQRYHWQGQHWLQQVPMQSVDCRPEPRGYSNLLRQHVYELLGPQGFAPLAPTRSLVAAYLPTSP